MATHDLRETSRPARIWLMAASGRLLLREPIMGTNNGTTLPGGSAMPVHHVLATSDVQHTRIRRPAFAWQS